MTSTRIIFSRPRKAAEPPPSLMPMEPVVLGEDGRWSVGWDDTDGFPSRLFAVAVWRQHNAGPWATRQ
jgi:hypothetical protein